VALAAQATGPPAGTQRAGRGLLPADAAALPAEHVGDPDGDDPAHDGPDQVGWLHAADFGTVPEAWLELVLARIKVGPARSPWTAMGALSLSGARTALGGLGRRPSVEARPDRLIADVPSDGARLRLSVTADDGDPVTVVYTDPHGGTRTVRHAALARVELALRRPGHPELTLSTTSGAYEYGTSQPMPGIVPQPLPEG